MSLSRRARLVIGLFLFAPAAWGARAGDEASPPRRGVARIGAAPRPLSSPTRLLYYGGRVVSNARVVAVFWGPDVDPAITGGIGGFYTAVIASPHIDWLSEYDTVGLAGLDGDPGSSQRIGRGSFAGAFTITPSSSGPDIPDSEIQAELVRQLRSGFLPAPALDAAGNVDTIYMISFPRGVTVIDEYGYRSCVQFCAYHGTIVYEGRSVPYGVLPDLSGMCDGACGTSPVKFENQTSVASHELVEAITDPEVGLCETVDRPLAWYDSDQGEIGDVCNGMQDTLGSYVVQQEWSNVYGACITVPPSGPNDFAVSISPAGAQVAPGSSVTYTVSTTALRGTVEPLALAVSGLPAGVTGTLAPGSVSSGGTSTLTVSAAPDAAASVARLDVTATGASASHTASATLTVTAAEGTSPAVRNGTFETGRLDGWTTSGLAAASADAHGGSWGAHLGGAVPSADSTLSQSFVLPSNASQLSFWVKVACPDTVTFDWATATLKDETTGVTTTLLPKTCTPAPAWRNVSASVSASAGHPVTLTFENHDDDWAGDATWSAWDDVQVVTGSSTRTNPGASVTQPTDGARLSGTVRVAVQASSQAPRVEVTLDGVLFGNAASTDALAFDWNTRGVADGPHALAARTVDDGGNVASSAPVNVTVANGASGARQLLSNPGFENGAVGAPWIATAGVFDRAPSEPAHSGAWKARLDGPGAPRTDTLAQAVAIPAGISRATLSFWLRVATDERTSVTEYDVLKVQVRDAAGVLLSTLGTSSNLDAAPEYRPRSFDLLPFSGRNVQILFVGTEDSSLRTSFSIDDVALDVE